MDVHRRDRGADGWIDRLAGVGVFVLLLGSCATRGVPPASSPAALEPAGATMVADRLFLGREIPGGGTVSDAEWAVFLENVVTPRFPEGLTVWRAEGQWRDPQGITVREPVMVLEVLYPHGSEAEASIAEIAEEYRRRFRQDAVLRVTEDAHVRFFD
ncbi:MAG: DUF3574 domain-containing protein [Gemmatimonadota bacterium]